LSSPSISQVSSGGKADGERQILRAWTEAPANNTGDTRRYFSRVENLAHKARQRNDLRVIDLALRLLSLLPTADRSFACAATSLQISRQHRFDCGRVAHPGRRFFWFSGRGQGGDRMNH